MLFKPKNLSNILYTLSLVILVLIFCFFKENLIHFVSRLYFDEGYYLKTYPEVKNLNISPFDHYITKGWQEGKNPSNNFNTNFYVSHIQFYYGIIKEDNPIIHCIRQNLHFKKCYANPSEIKKVDTLLKKPKYNLAIVSLFNNEARFLKEWIEFYRLVGVEHFYLYNHLSTDNYMEVLEPYIKDNIVDLRHINRKPENSAEWYEIQNSTFSKQAKEVGDQVEWLMAIDTDEFLFPIKEDNLVNSLKSYNECPALSVNWVLFGTSNIEKIPDNKLLIETIIKSNYKQADLYVKSIVKPRYVDNYIDPHYPLLASGYAQCTENHDYFYGSLSPTQSIDTIRINHYWSRDLEFFREKKLNRLHVLDKNLNVEEKEQQRNGWINRDKDISKDLDLSIIKYINSLRIKLAYDKQNATLAKHDK